MEEIKREVVTEEVITYKLTKEELDNIKQEERSSILRGCLVRN